MAPGSLLPNKYFALTYTDTAKPQWKCLDHKTFSITSSTPQDDLFDKDGPSPNTLERPASPLSCLNALELAAENQPSHSDESDVEIDIDKHFKAIHAIEDNKWGAHDKAMDEALLNADSCESQLQKVSKWYPFKKKEVCPF
ncbi:hypothetical protein DFH28DRAFT_1081528 [Melampsora americana]|nr:hypothetical protein DFH28DRAFT_1081528 [Melampsora americana]